MYQNKEVAVLIAAAGFGKRMGGQVAKQYRELGGMPVLSRTIAAFERHALIDSIYIIGQAEQLDYCRRATVEPYGFSKVRALVAGGKQRQDSVRQGLCALGSEQLILIHDGARPFVTAEIITQTIEAAAEHGAAAAAVPVKDTIKVVQAAADGTPQAFCDTPDRSRLYQIQTPQGFLRPVIEAAFENAYAQGFYGTDDAVLVERTGRTVVPVMGDYRNIKLTTAEDMAVGEAILQTMQEWQKPSQEDGLPPHDTPPSRAEYKVECRAKENEMSGQTSQRPWEYRMGTGFDVHQLVEGRKLILGGVEIPWQKGLLGHSDADVMVHAVMDALLGAAALGDIGRHFPDSDEAYRGADSLKLLEKVVGLLQSNSFMPVNVDATIIAQRPKIAPHIPQMRKNLAGILWPDLSEEEAVLRVNIKATTTEQLGFCGREEGIASQAAVCLCTL